MNANINSNNIILPIDYAAKLVGVSSRTLVRMMMRNDIKLTSSCWRDHEGEN